MRTQWVLVGLALSLARFSSAGADETISKVPTPPAKAQEPPLDEMLHRYLLAEAREHFDARRKAIAAIKTPEDIARRQKELRAFFLRSLGEMPARTPLHPRIVGTLKRDGYRVEKILFESRPNHHVTANLYIPEGKPPLPGVLMPCGHSDNGKAYEGYQRACILLARNGMAVLCYDPIGQGERYQMLDAKGKPVIRGTTEHTMAGIGALLVGRELASYRIWDGFRALDYLASRPEVDSRRLGCTGNSGGGTMTSYLMALDDRIAVAAPSCFITSLERLFATIGPQDAEQNITGQVAAGMEHADYVTLRAPKPTLLTVGTRDFFDIQGSWDTFREVKLIYGRLGFGERVDLFESDEEHGFTRPRRVATARWMRRWLLQKDDAVDEPDFPVASDAELQCTQTGQVLTDFKDGSVFDLNRRRAEELGPRREAASGHSSKEAFRSDVSNRLGLANWKVKPAAPHVQAVDSERKLEFELGPGLVIPAIELHQGERSDRGPTVVKVGVDWDRERAAGPASASGAGPRARVLLVDPRGMGKTTPRAEAGRPPSPFGRDWRDAYIALYIGRPLLGQRVADLLSMLEGLAAVSTEKEQRGFHLVGVGAAGPVVLHAALLDEHGLIKRVTLERSLISWADVVERGISQDQMGNVVPGVLKAYDLPDLAARLAPVPLTIQAPVNAMGEPVSQPELERTYAQCARAYGPGGELVLRAQANDQRSP
jgi:cephalosporin-C deacetylase-like acetyl esterase/pimeloyl-ACP methyl ester carboxylesterase